MRRALLIVAVMMLMASPAWAVTASDDFNRSEDPLSTGWSTGNGFTGCKAVVTAAGGSTVGVDNVSIYTGVTWNADHYSEGVVAVGLTNDGSPLVRGSASAAQGYTLDVVAGGASVWTVYKITAGPTFTSIAGGDFGAAVAAGDTLRLEVTTVGGNAVLVVKRNGSSSAATSGSLTDSTSPHLSGSPGIQVFSNVGVFWDSWNGADIGTSTAASPPTLMLLGIGP